MITWKVRGRSSSQTPELARTPMRERDDELHQASVCRRAAARGGAVAAHRLVRQRDQDQRGRADHQR